jgi:glycosyltransferase involved in cell wall biosynthesis
LPRVRPSVDVVVPFRGGAPALGRLIDRLGRLHLGSGDTLTVVDNSPDGVEPDRPAGPARVVHAPARQSSYHARNRGAAGGRAEWLLFLDADVEAPPDLIDRYFADAPGDRTAVLAGAVADRPPAAGGRESIAGRYARVRRLIDQQNTLGMTRPYAKTANCAVRRTAFEQVGGFTDGIRSGGDADLCFRMRAAGWQFEPRDEARVVHRSRRAMRALLRQQARHGAGAAWLEREYPGSFPRARWPGLAKWSAGSVARAAVARSRGRGDEAVVAAVDPLVKWAFELGRLFPNEVGER